MTAPQAMLDPALAPATCACQRSVARRTGERLALSVWDDGPGFDLNDAPDGHGLETLRARLAVLFGPSHFVALDRSAASGADLWRTPLGDVLVDGDLRAAAVSLHELQRYASMLQELLAESQKPPDRIAA